MAVVPADRVERPLDDGGDGVSDGDQSVEGGSCGKGLPGPGGLFVLPLLLTVGERVYGLHDLGVQELLQTEGGIDHRAHAGLVELDGAAGYTGDVGQRSQAQSAFGADVPEAVPVQFHIESAGGGEDVRGDLLEKVLGEGLGGHDGDLEPGVHYPVLEGARTCAGTYEERVPSEGLLDGLEVIRVAAGEGVYVPEDLHYQEDVLPAGGEVEAYAALPYG